jgi:hypothetical protein
MDNSPLVLTMYVHVGEQAAPPASCSCPGKLLPNFMLSVAWESLTSPGMYVLPDMNALIYVLLAVQNLFQIIYTDKIGYSQ